MAGYSGKPLVEKLGLKAGHRVALVDAPADFAATLEPLPSDVAFVGPRAPEADVVVLFSREAARLEPAFAAAVHRLAAGGMIWVAWPKKAAKQPTDLGED